MDWSRAGIPEFHGKLWVGRSGNNLGSRGVIPSGRSLWLGSFGFLPIPGASIESWDIPSRKGPTWSPAPKNLGILLNPTLRSCPGSQPRSLL